MFSKLRSEVTTKLDALDPSDCKISISGVSYTSDSSRGNLPAKGPRQFKDEFLNTPGYDHCKRGSLAVESISIKIARRYNTIIATNDSSSDDDGNLNSKFHSQFPFTLGQDQETKIAKPLIVKG
jgi:hypothetical protein